MCYDQKPPTPMPLIEVAGMLARSNKGMCASAVRDAIARISALEAERDSLRRRKEHFERTAYALETTLQACAQRLNCEPDGQVVVELDKALAENDELRKIAALAARIHSTEPDTVEEYDERSQCVVELRKLLDAKEH